MYMYSNLVPKTCHVYHLKGATESGSYIIDPDGPGYAPPFTAYCDFATGNLAEQNLLKSLKLKVNQLKPFTNILQIRNAQIFR